MTGFLAYFWIVFVFFKCYVSIFVFGHFVFPIFPTLLCVKPWENATSNEGSHMTDFLAYSWTVFVFLYFGIFMSVSSYFVLYVQFFQLSSPESPGKMPLRTREPICLKYSRPHIEIHRKVPLAQAQAPTYQVSTEMGHQVKNVFFCCCNESDLGRQLFKKLRWTQKPRFHIRIYLRPCVNNILKNLFPVKLERTCFCQNSGKIPLKSPSKYHKCPIVHSKTYMKGNAKHHDMV